MDKRILVLLAGCFLLLAACGAARTPVRQFIKGDEIAYYDFSEPGSFEEGTYQDGAARLQVTDGKYVISVTEGDNEMWFGQWGSTLRNVILDVEARQETETENTVYGVICRARGTVGQSIAELDPELAALASQDFSGELLAAGDTGGDEAEATEAPDAEVTAEADSTAEPTELPVFEEGASSTVSGVNNGDGYLFLVEGNGRFAIMRSRGGALTPLVDWTFSGAIRKGAAQNTIRAVCVDDYLAMYINDEFVGDAVDDFYTEGQVGLVAAGASRLGVMVLFDNLTVAEVQAE